MVPIWYMQVRQPAHSDIVTDHTKFEGSCQNPFLGAQARNVAPWAEGRILAGGGYAARRGGRRLGLERGLLDDSGHRLQPPGRTAARPQRRARSPPRATIGSPTRPCSDQLSKPKAFLCTRQNA